MTAASSTKGGNTDRAIENCTAAIESGLLSDAQLVDALNRRGPAYLIKGEYDRAIQDCDKAIKIDPRLANSFVKLALHRRWRRTTLLIILGFCEQEARRRPG